MAVEISKPINRLLKLKVGNEEMEVVVEISDKGLKFKRKGKRKAIETSWNKLLSTPGGLTLTDDSPKVTNKEAAKLAENPLAFLFDA